MKQPSILWIALAASSLVATPIAIAHSNHDDMRKLTPDTCDQLADRTRYSNDLANPNIKALKDKCDAEAVTAKEAKASGESASEMKPKSKDQK